MVGTSACKEDHLEKNGGSQVSRARKRALHHRDLLLVQRFGLSAPGFHAEVIKDRAKVNGDSSAVIPHSHPLQ